MQLSNGLVDGNYIHHPSQHRRRSHQRRGQHRRHENAGDPEQHDLQQHRADRRGHPSTRQHPVCRWRTRPSRTTSSRAAATPSTGVHRLCLHYLQHRHQEQPVRPALLPEERPVWSRCLLRLRREGERRSGNIGPSPGRLSPPRDLTIAPRRCGTPALWVTATSARLAAPCQVRRPFGPIELAGPACLSPTGRPVSPIPPPQSQRPPRTSAQGGAVGQRAGLRGPLSASVRNY